MDSQEQPVSQRLFVCKDYTIVACQLKWDDAAGDNFSEGFTKRFKLGLKGKEIISLHGIASP